MSGAKIIKGPQEALKTLENVHNIRLTVHYPTFSDGPKERWLQADIVPGGVKFRIELPWDGSSDITIPNSMARELAVWLLENLKESGDAAN